MATAVGFAWLAARLGPSILVGAYTALTVIANITAAKLIALGPIAVPSAVIAYSATFLITDYLTEIWGKHEAQKAVTAGIAVNLLLILYTYIAAAWPPPPYAQQIAEAAKTILQQTPRITIASITAFITSQTLDIHLFHKIRKATHGKHLWLRNNTATILSQLTDTTIFITLAFYGLYPILPLITSQFTVKLLIALLDTPFCYLGCHIIRKHVCANAKKETAKVEASYPSTAYQCTQQASSTDYSSTSLSQTSPNAPPQ